MTSPAQLFPQRGEERAARHLARLHPSGIRDRGDIRELLLRVLREKVHLRRGMNRRIHPETARIEAVDADSVLLRTANFDASARREIFLNFSLDGQAYFFSAPFLRRAEQDLLRVGIPSAVYRTERRDRARRRPGQGESTRVALRAAGGSPTEAEIVDASPEGLALGLASPEVLPLGAALTVRFLDGWRAGEELYAEVRSRTPLAGRPDWTRIGLGVSAWERGAALQVERRERVLPSSALGRARDRWRLLSAGVRLASDRVRGTLRVAPQLPPVETLEYANRAGEGIRAIVDSWGPTRGAPAIVIPPAWGRTKETLMPLAACIVETFRRAREPVAVVRFDGIRKRGESHNEPECCEPGRDHHRFTFSQGMRDIEATLDFLHASPRFGPPTTILVSFSAAAIEARRAVATDGRIGGWISVVGAPDVQSMMRVISGGIDYVVGLERGLRFGLQEVLGIQVDMDYAGLDCFRHELAYLEDSRRDAAAIDVPVTWIHGRYDAWMDANRVRDVLSRGDTRRRRFIEVPTGHILKTSREALETFQLITSEVARMALGREIPPALLNLAALGRRGRAERGRLSNDTGDLRGFWRDYLLGRDRILGMELMTSIGPYRELMETQVRALRLRSADRVADLGAGTGAFPLHLATWSPRPEPLQVFEVDYLREALDRARERMAERGLPPGLRVAGLLANLDVQNGSLHVPLGSGSIDAVLAALFLSYVNDPTSVLREIHRILRPGGRLVVSTLRCDADMSKLYTEGVVELRSGRAHELFGAEGEGHIDEAARGYLNQAARLLDLEERGVFRFWDPPELVRLVTRAGFRKTATWRTLGHPPQAVVLSAERA